MAKVQVAVRLDEQMVAELDELARRQGTTRTEVIERAIEHGLSAENSFTKIAESPAAQDFVALAEKLRLLEPLARMFGTELDKRKVEIAGRLRQERKERRKRKVQGENA
jgi:metal-responsive CopG/Arc/MetJ family transcriptional regulator